MSTMIDTGAAALHATKAMEAARHGDVPLDTRALRNALGSYPTGVAIVTTRLPGGRPVGLTINSFASLSLEPPLVLWSLVKRSPSLEAFAGCAHFSINVLAAGQADLARSFASSAVPDKFAHVAAHDSPEGVPLMPGSLASFVCASEQVLDGGDHTLFIGRVLRYHTGEGEPAVFHRGQFTLLQTAC
ncbi:NADH-FMN oxidoreductase RutF, flavin reductase (DIM6/NTAB) family [Pseudoduganella namucuonensis]|uniref:NADH-FMN oxidoreductase RutF, flavin reductase (DIM6/NTAB) family n=2 Tax=Pseudoduganella namucuonensis TaxID=1035707 RepID=A0A1I7LUP9_9BURK|nr:NADH-FMN oxidoreductase RutF, flavin reductase (DIM6/NTAB) family [Pseudoduganella namucuonensis]